MSPRNGPIPRPLVQRFFQRIRRSRVRAQTTCAELDEFLARAVAEHSADTAGRCASSNPVLARVHPGGSVEGVAADAPVAADNKTEPPRIVFEMRDADHSIASRLARKPAARASSSVD